MEEIRTREQVDIEITESLWENDALDAQVYSEWEATLTDGLPLSSRAKSRDRHQS
jgi:hypothetical protein